MSATNESKRARLDKLRSQLQIERSSFDSHWRELSDYFMPRRSRFQISDANKGDRRNTKIIDATGTLALRTLRSGMMSGVTSPARPWFRLTTPDPEMSEIGTVKEWLYFVSQRMATMFLRSNLYNILPITYGDMGTFATAATLIEEDFNRVLHAYSFPIGSYYVAATSKGKVNVFSRDFRMTVRQIVETFGKREANGQIKDWSNISEYTKNSWDNGHYEHWVDVAHVIEPNNDFDPRSPIGKKKKYSSCYYEQGGSGTSSNAYSGLGSYSSVDENKYLRESGYDYFPVLVPRWEVTGEDVYGTDCPGMLALGDTKALQTMQKRTAQAIEKMVNPAMVASANMRNSKATILPGDITFVPPNEQNAFRPAHEVNPRVNEILVYIQDHQNRIRRICYEDLFLMLASSDRREMTAREVSERHEEKLLALGPVLERLNQDLLDPLIDIAFDLMAKQGFIPEPPEEIQGMPLKVEYISIMAQAQKLVGTSVIERFAGFASQVVAANPESADKIDADELIDVYGEMMSVPPGIVRTDEEVEERRQARAKQQQQMQAAAMMQQGAATAKDLSQADTSGDNALTRILEQANAGSLVQ